MAGDYAGGASYASGSMFTSIGNSVYFQDLFPTGQQLLAGLGISMLTAGIMNGVSDPNYDFIGLRVTPVQVDPLPLPNPVGVTVKDLNLPTNIGDNLSEVNSTNDFQSAPQGTPDAANPMQGKVMTTVRGLDGKVSYVFKSSESESGSYKLDFESGKQYMGKGLEPRMIQSINRIEQQTGDVINSATFYPAESTRAAFINEYLLQLNSGELPLNWDENSNLYNKIWSPGKKLW